MTDEETRDEIARLATTFDSTARDHWAFEIHSAFRGATWFTAGLLNLIAKADPYNTERIRLGFPREVAAWEAYKRGELEHEMRRLTR